MDDTYDDGNSDANTLDSSVDVQLLKGSINLDEITILDDTVEDIDIDGGTKCQPYSKTPKAVQTKGMQTFKTNLK